MDFQTLHKNIDEFDAHFNKKFPIKSHREKAFARTVKLTEELGELCNEVLAANGDQRSEKLETTSNRNLEDEFADVIITTLLLAKTMNVNIEKALEQKIEKINQRFS
jgi:NTP pyrophosphatase (non-canonical NTP hydrolase)